MSNKLERAARAGAASATGAICGITLTPGSATGIGAAGLFRTGCDFFFKASSFAAASALTGG